MCGIAGIIVSHADRGRFDVASIISWLGLEIESRGRHATGVARLTASGRVKVTKAPRPAKEFFGQRSGLGADSVMALVHTRHWTQGPPSNALNNHPLIVGDITGIHNGMIYNDFELYRDNPEWKRQGEVDSEAIFAAIHHKGAKEGLEAIEGSFAVAWMANHDPGALWLARGRSSPLYLGVAPSGTAIFCSTWTGVKQSFKALDMPDVKPESVPEGQMIRLAPLDEGGMDVARTSFKPLADPFEFNRTTVRVSTQSWSRVESDPTPAGGRSSDWAVGGDGWVLRPDDQVAFVPDNAAFPVVFGKFSGRAFRVDRVWVSIDFDGEHSDTVAFPRTQVFPAWTGTVRDAVDIQGSMRATVPEQPRHGALALVEGTDQVDDLIPACQRIQVLMEGTDDEWTC